MFSYKLFVAGNSGFAHTTTAKIWKDVFFVAKEVVKKIKLQIPAGKATPAPPVGTVLGPAGINLQEFCTRFNDASKD